MTDKNTTIKAQFADGEYCFRLHDFDIPILERETGQGVLELMHRMVRGGWRVDHVKLVLVLGMQGHDRGDWQPTERDTTMREMGALASWSMKTVNGTLKPYWELVNEHVVAGKLDEAAKVAALVLGAALYGVKEGGDLNLEAAE